MNYEQHDDVATLTFDDGKANAIGMQFMADIDAGLDRAEAEAKAVVITGRAGLLSGGFDLKVIREGGDAVRDMMAAATDMFYRLYAHPQPLVIACPGHAVAAGAFLLLSADNRVGTAGDFKIGLNETAIAATFPVFAIQLATTRLQPAYLTRCFVQAELLSPEDAIHAGFLDEIRPVGDVLPAAQETAARLGKLPGKAYARNKLDSRRAALTAIAADRR